MRVVIQAQPDASGVVQKPYSFEIAAGGVESPAGLKINGSNSTQIFEGLRADSISAKDRGNVKTSIAFDITRRHSNISEAQSYMLLHQSTIPASGTVVFYMENGTNLYMRGSAIQTVNSHHTGTTTFHSYALIGGKISSI